MMIHVDVKLLIALLLSCSAVQAKEFFFPTPTLPALTEAIMFANENPEEVIVTLGPEFVLDTTDQLPAIKGTVDIRPVAGSTVIRPTVVTPPTLFTIESEGTLKLSGMVFSGFNSSSLHRAVEFENNRNPLIRNMGRLSVSNSVFKDITSVCFSGGFVIPPSLCGPVIENENHAKLRNVVFENITSGLFGPAPPSSLLITSNGGQVEFFQVSVIKSGFSNLTQFTQPIPLIQINAGTLVIKNSTLTGEKTGLSSMPGAVIELANSIVDFKQENCMPNTVIKSSGFNLSSDDTCNLNAENDLTDVDPGFTSPKTRTLNSTSIAVVLPDLSPASPAVDTANPALCFEPDLFGLERIIDGNQDGVKGCDRGAMETGAVSLASGGANGMYYSPEADGHYVTILDNINDTTILLWSAFDKFGNQAWVYGVGSLINGRSMIVDAYINEGGALLDDGGQLPATGEEWGKIQFDLDNCNQGLVKYRSQREAFGSGQFNIRRLVAVKQLGCVD